MEKKLISIIVPIYNVEKYLTKCIDSLINQTYKNIEIFLVDDGSPDNCGKICDKYEKKDKRIVVIHKENGGYGSVLEYAINHVKGEYFLICDPDDWLEGNCVEELVNNNGNGKVDLVVGRTQLVYLDGAIETKKINNIEPNIVYNNFELFASGFPCSPHSKLYKTSIGKKIKFPEKINYTDYLLYYYYLSNIKSIVYVDKKLANYFIDRPGNSMNENIKITEKAVISQLTMRKALIIQLNKKSDIIGIIMMNIYNDTLAFYIDYKYTKNISSKYDEDFQKIFELCKTYKNYAKIYYRMKDKLNGRDQALIRTVTCRFSFNKLSKKIVYKLLHIRNLLSSKTTKNEV